MYLKRTSHAVYDTKYHSVCPQIPQWMKDEIGRRRELLEVIARGFGFETKGMEVGSDHVHLFLLFPPRYAMAKVVGILKSISSGTLLEGYSEVREKLWRGEF